MIKKTSKKLAFVMATAVAFTSVQFPTTMQDVDASETGIIINQVYGGGGKGDTPIEKNFIEIYNASSENVNLENYSLVYGDLTYNFTSENIIPAKGSWLITGNSETTSDDLISYDLPEADSTWDITISNKVYTIELKQGDNVIDSITADEDSIDENIHVSKQKTLRRINYQDTDSNVDFEVIGWKKEDGLVNAEYVLSYAPSNSAGEKGIVHGAKIEPTYTAVETSDEKVTGFDNGENALNMELIARYNSKALCADGGSMEIVQYNENNGYAYTVSGLKGLIVASNIKTVESGEKVVDLAGTEYDVKPLVEKVGATYGDITSVAISKDGTKLAAAIQHSDYDKNGYVVMFECKADGTLSNPVLYNVGVQPDNVVFVDDNTILTADEGEPCNGYAEGNVDPKGTVSVVKLDTKESTQIDFSRFTADQLIQKNILIGVVEGKNIDPVTDLEPEYIAVSQNGKKAYVSLQEANAIAVLDIETKQFTDILSCGFEDYSKVAVDIVEDGKYEAKTYENLISARMPDGISLYETNGKTYVLTANEGDAREWGDYKNEAKDKSFTGDSIRVLDKECVAGLPDGKTVMYGGRSFTIFEVTADGLKETFDSKNEFEKITAEKVPNYFNCSNDDIDVDSRSGKKGPEPETVITGSENGKTYAFIALERTGGIMAYDITTPSDAKYANYINSREFGAEIQGDVSPEGLCFVKSNTSGNAVLLAACEVSGTLAAYELTSKVVKPIETTTEKSEITTTETTTQATTQATTVDNVTKKVIPGKGKISKVSAKVKTSKKISIKLKKIKLAKGYQIQISKAFKFNKKTVLVNKIVRKVKFAIVSKKLRNRNKLYVRTRAYTLSGNKKIYGKWSAIKKAKIKK